MSGHHIQVMKVLRHPFDANRNGYKVAVAAFFFGSFLSGGLGPLGCAVEQESECKTYLDCMSHYNDVFGRENPDLSDYEEGGDCWQDSQTADICKDNCIEATHDLADALELANEDTGPCQ